MSLCGLYDILVGVGIVLLFGGLRGEKRGRR